jgi:hypothetical protein
VEVKFWRAFVGFALYYRKTNEEIREELGVCNLSNYIVNHSMVRSQTVGRRSCTIDMFCGGPMFLLGTTGGGGGGRGGGIRRGRS